MPFKLTMYMSVFRQAWSEAYLNSGVWPSSQATQNITTLLAARAALLGANAQLFSARVSGFPANRLVTDLDNFSFPVTGQWNPRDLPLEANSNIANVSLMMTFGTTVGQKRIYLAGLPDAVINSDAVAPLNYMPATITGFAATLDTFVNALIAGGWGCRSWKATVPIQSLGLQAGIQTPPLIGVQLATAQPWAVGQKVLLGGWRRINPRSPGLSGVYTIVGVPPATQTTPPFVYYLFGTQNVSPTNFKTIGTIGLLSFEIVPFNGPPDLKGVTRKRGGRSLLPLGRLLRSH